MTTSGKFEVKAGQHLFMGSANANIPALPDLRIKTEHRNFQAIDSSKNEPLEEYLIQF